MTHDTAKAPPVSVGVYSAHELYDGEELGAEAL